MLSLTELKEKYQDFIFSLTAVHSSYVILIGRNDSLTDQNVDTRVELRYKPAHAKNKLVMVRVPPINPKIAGDESAYNISIRHIPQPSEVIEHIIPTKAGKDAGYTPKSTKLYSYEPRATAFTKSKSAS